MTFKTIFQRKSSLTIANIYMAFLLCVLEGVGWDLFSENTLYYSVNIHMAFLLCVFGDEDLDHSSEKILFYNSNIHKSFLLCVLVYDDWVHFSVEILSYNSNIHMAFPPVCDLKWRRGWLALHDLLLQHGHWCSFSLSILRWMSSRSSVENTLPQCEQRWHLPPLLIDIPHSTVFCPLSTISPGGEKV